jgi:hypothetical protein
MTPELQRLGRKVVIVIATDGLPSNENDQRGPKHDQEFVEALRLLEGLPVWVVVRLCTDDKKTVDFYNDLDSQLELSLEVLDDFSGEALEVKEDNPWLNYALPLHRLREMGYHDRVFDMLDERALTKTEIRDFCSLLFGEANFDGVPDPSMDWKGFLEEVQGLLEREAAQWVSKTKCSTSFGMSKISNTYHFFCGAGPGEEKGASMDQHEEVEEIAQEKLVASVVFIDCTL